MVRKNKLVLLFISDRSREEIRGFYHNIIPNYLCVGIYGISDVLYDLNPKFRGSHDSRSTGSHIYSTNYSLKENLKVIKRDNDFKETALYETED